MLVATRLAAGFRDEVIISPDPRICMQRGSQCSAHIVFPLKNISDCKRRPAETDRAFAPFIRRRPKGDMYPDAMPTGYRQSSQRSR